MISQVSAASSFLLLRGWCARLMAWWWSRAGILGVLECFVFIYDGYRHSFDFFLIFMRYILSCLIRLCLAVLDDLWWRFACFMRAARLICADIGQEHYAVGSCRATTSPVFLIFSSPQVPQARVSSIIYRDRREIFVHRSLPKCGGFITGEPPPKSAAAGETPTYACRRLERAE